MIWQRTKSGSQAVQTIMPSRAIGELRPQPAAFTRDRIKLPRFQTVKITKSAPSTKIPNFISFPSTIFIRSFQ